MISGRYRMAVVAAALMIGFAVQAQVITTPVTAIPRAHIYPSIESAQADGDAALAEARRTHKRVILDFGGDWCPDCQVLNIYFHQSPNAELLAKYYILVDVNIAR